MHIPFSKTEKLTTPEGTIWDYPLGKDIGISYQTLSARGPAKGNYLNTKCHEIYFIIDGEASFVIKGEASHVGKNDVVVVEPNTPHHIETDRLVYITITRPDWYPEQYQEVV